MRNEPTADPPEFDHHAAKYDADLMRGISVSGETRDYFARGRAEWVRRCLCRLGAHPHAILDYGCGTGVGCRCLLQTFRPAKLVGVDVSGESLQVARREFSQPNVAFLATAEYRPCSEMDLAFCSGVFHHIPLAQRPSVLTYILKSLRPGGFLAFWENNPWNPGARLVMRRIPFDRNAIPISPSAARRLIAAGGFEIDSTYYLFIFPRALRLLRPIESKLSRMPLGAQYMVLCRKPVAQGEVQGEAEESRWKATE